MDVPPGYAQHEPKCVKLCPLPLQALAAVAHGSSGRPRYHRANAALSRTADGTNDRKATESQMLLQTPGRCCTPLPPTHARQTQTYQHHQHQRHVLLEHQRSSPCAPTSACAGTRGCSSGQLCICCSAQTRLPFLRPLHTPHITLHCPSPSNLSASGLRQRSPDGPSPLAKFLLPQIQRGLLIQPYRHRGPARGCWFSKEPLQQ